MAKDKFTQKCCPEILCVELGSGVRRREKALVEAKEVRCANISTVEASIQIRYETYRLPVRCTVDHTVMMSSKWLYRLLIMLALLNPSSAVKCYCTDDTCVPYGACDGGVCMVGILRENNQVIRTCGSRAVGCHRDVDDKWTDLCACDQPFCNTFSYLRSHTRSLSRPAVPDWTDENWSHPIQDPVEDEDVNAVAVFHRMDRPEGEPPPPPVPISTRTSLLTLLLVVVPLTVGGATIVVLALNYYSHLC